jgi:hypothetical protein
MPPLYRQFRCVNYSDRLLYLPWPLWAFRQLLHNFVGRRNAQEAKNITSFGRKSIGQMSFCRKSIGQMSFGRKSIGQMSFGRKSIGQMSFGQVSFSQHAMVMSGSLN